MDTENIDFMVTDESSPDAAPDEGMDAAEETAAEITITEETIPEETEAAEESPVPEESPTPEESPAPTAETGAAEGMEDTLISGFSTEPVVVPTEPAPEESPVPDVAPTPTPTPTEAVVVSQPPTEPPPPDPDVNGWSVLIGFVLLAAILVVAWILLCKKKGLSPMVWKWKIQPVRESVVNAPATEALDAPGDYHGPSVSVGMAQTIGARLSQQDSMYCSDWQDQQVLASRGLLAAVADGIGGLKNGDAASNAAMRSLRSRFADSPAFGELCGRLLELSAAAHKEVLALNRKSNASCGTTLVSVLISDWKMAFLSIGDSRIYLYRAGALLQLNREHKLGTRHQEQYQLGQEKEFASSRPEALTSYVGKDDLRQIDRIVRPITLIPGDKILLMSDGVYGTLDDRELLALARLAPAAGAETAIRKVTEKRYQHQDNASIMIIGIQ